MTTISFQSQSRHQRRGAITALMAILLPTLFILGAMAINIAYIQLTRSELMVATDAAARAGGRAMSFYQDVEQAKIAAQVTAGLNSVAGEALRLSTEDSHNEIEFGDCVPSEHTDRYAFEKVDTASIQSGTDAANAVRINGVTTNVALIFPSLGSDDTFDVQIQSVAMQVDRDIALVLDRSGSMSWVDYDWPPGFSPWNTTVYDAAVDAGILYKNYHYYYNSGQNSTTFQNWVYTDYLNLGPSPPPSPWQELIAAVDTFLNVLEETDQNELVSLGTYSNSGTLNLTLQSDYDLVRQTLSNVDPYGATGIGNGMNAAFPSLTGGDARPFAAKTIIVMTDGMHNTGVSPESVATNIVTTADVTIHTVTFGSDADVTRMAAVAAIGGGSHYHADDGDELVDVFEEIANNLPTIVTQ